MRKFKIVLWLLILALINGCGGGKGKEDKEFIYPFKESFIVNLTKESGVDNTPNTYLKVRMGLGVSTDKVSGEIGIMEFKVRDRINYILSRQTIKSIASDSGKDNIKREVKEALNKFLNEGEVKDIFFYEFVTQ